MAGLEMMARGGRLAYIRPTGTPYDREWPESRQTVPVTDRPEPYPGDGDFERMLGNILEKIDMADQAAYTQPDSSYPAYINIQRVEGGYQVIVRTAHQSNVSQLVVPEDAWHQLMADAMRLQAPGG